MPLLSSLLLLARLTFPQDEFDFGFLSALSWMYLTVLNSLSGFGPFPASWPRKQVFELNQRGVEQSTFGAARLCVLRSTLFTYF